MKIRYLYIILLSCLSFSMISCEDDANDWEFDESYDKLFRSTLFDYVELRSTSVMLEFRGVTDATKYVLEFSEGDSLEFTNIVRTEIIEVDTLTPYSEAPSIVLTKYRKQIDDLKGTTPYSVRLKAISDARKMESDYISFYFETPDEQIFTNVVPSLDKATISWKQELAVTHIMYWERVTVVEGQELVEPEKKRFNLTDAHRAAGRATIPDLASGTIYETEIFNDDAKRGFRTFQTLGSKNGVGKKTIMIDTSQATSINDILVQCVTEQVRVVTLAFKGDQIYEIEKISVPVNIDMIYLVGDVAGDQKLPELYLHRMEFAAPINSVIFQSVDMNARLNSSNFVFSLDNTNSFKNLRFDGCKIRNISRSLVRPNHADLDINQISINNSILENIGVNGYGMFNMGKDVANLGEISITNSTIREIGSERLMHLKGGIKKVEIDKVIICNYTSSSGHIFRLDSQPTEIIVKNSIFTGDNKGAKINAGNSDYEYLEYYGCFLTSDFVVNKNVFTNATILEMTSEEMFEDPRNGIFYLKEGVRFAGEGKVGDPRWWSK